MLKKLNLNIFWQEVIFFLAGYVFVYWGYKQLQKIPPSVQEIYFSGKVVFGPQNSIFNNQALIFIIYFALGTIAIYFILKRFKNPRHILNFLYYIALAGGLSLFLGVIFKPTPTAQVWSMFLTLVIILIRIRYPLILVQNLVFLATIAGISIFFAKQIQMKHLILILIILAIYDFIAVYLTKHMVFMAEKIAKYGIGLFLILPKSLKDYLSIVQGENLRTEDKRYVLLGGGDIAFPLILVANIASESLAKSLIVFISAFIGLLISHLIFAFTQKPVPALPSIVFLSLAGYLLTKYFF